MKELVKAFEGHRVRIHIERGIPSFCLSDVCDVLELDQTSRLVRDGLEKDGVAIRQGIDRLGRTQDVAFISEPNLYRLIFRSRKAEAKSFQNFVFEEVLPAIRKTGHYELPADLRAKSKEARNHFTQVLNEHGVKSPTQYIKLTGTMKKNVGIPGNKSKDQMTRAEIMRIQAAEILAALNIEQYDVDGYDEVKPICQGAALAISSATIQKEKAVAL